MNDQKMNLSNKNKSGIQEQSEDTTRPLEEGGDIGELRPSQPPQPMTPEERAKMLVRVVCICKGINLGRVLKGMEGCTSVAEVHRKVGTGSGGCRGERCSPRIRSLLKKSGQHKDP